ncbi:MAG TPA: DUF1499 domain-containing protein [Longimicrobium sp.]|nr:DUF1499 domain-containing protein [Longimicrobium sp.]
MTRTSAIALAPVLLLLAACATAPRGVSAPGAGLAPCPPSPNCVSTEAAAARHAMPPIAYTGPAEAAQAHARAALLAEPRTRIVLEAPGYLRAEARSRIFRFVDDVEVVIDGAARVVRFRSVSRLGHGDLGVNRRRMTRFTERFRALQAQAAR